MAETHAAEAPPPVRSPKRSCLGMTRSLLQSPGKAAHLTSFSESPRYLDATVEGAQFKKVALPPATARASIVLPVPGGPNSSTPRQGSLMPAAESRGR